MAGVNERAGVWRTEEVAAQVGLEKKDALRVRHGDVPTDERHAWHQLACKCIEGRRGGSDGS